MTPKLQELANRIVELRRFTKETGIQTNRSQSALVANLDPLSLSTVAAEVNRQLAEINRQTDRGNYANTTK